MSKSTDVVVPQPEFPFDLASKEARILATQAGRNPPRLGLDPEDLRQRLLLEAVKAWPKHQPSLGLPMTYLSGVMRKQVLAEKRRAARLKQRELAAKAGRSECEKLRSRPFAVNEQIATAELKQAALAAVPTEDREVARLILEGEGDAAIGAKVGRHRGNVHLTRRRLRSIWSKFEAEWRDKWASARRYGNDAPSQGGRS